MFGRSVYFRTVPGPKTISDHFPRRCGQVHVVQMPCREFVFLLRFFFLPKSQRGPTLDFRNNRRVRDADRTVVAAKIITTLDSRRATGPAKVTGDADDRPGR